MQRKIIISFAVSILFLAVWTFALAASTAGSTVTVNVTGDLGDANPGDGVCDRAPVIPGAQCTLRAAIEELNAQGSAAPPHRIEFNLPGVGPFTITPASALPAITVPVEVDGETQPGAACPTSAAPANLMIVLDGNSAGTDANGLVFESGSDGSSVRGLVIGNFTGDGIRVLSDGNRIRCNHIGLQADGISPMGNDNGIALLGHQNEVGGANAHATRNVISSNQVRGIAVNGSQHTIANNFIGTTADGMGELGNVADGLRLDADDILVGGAGAIARNVISGNGGSGIEAFGGDNNAYIGNYIGVARDGATPLANGNHGIYLFSSAWNNLIGGTGSGERNIIAYNGRAGVVLQTYSFLGTFPTQTRIQGNAIYGNGALNDPLNSREGIDLGGDGPDLNDPGDGDSGENERQNYPVLASTPGSFIVAASLDSQPNTTYEIDVYSNSGCDPLAPREGRQYLETMAVTTDGSGQTTFEIDLTGKVSSGNGVSVTVTDPSGNTSEFSTCVTISALQTLTPTPTETASPSPTSTTTATEGPSPTPTNTATPGPSPTPTNTFTPGPSPTPTATATEGPSPTPTNTATPGPSPTPTGTFTPGPSPTPTATATEGPSPTPTNTATPGPSPTPTTPSAATDPRLYLPLLRQ